METATTTMGDPWPYLRAQALVLRVAADRTFLRASLVIAAARRMVAESSDMRQRREHRPQVELLPDAPLTHLVEWSLHLRSGLQRHALLAEARVVLISPAHVPSDPDPETRSAVLDLIADWSPSSTGHEGTPRFS